MSGDIQDWTVILEHLRAIRDKQGEIDDILIRIEADIKALEEKISELATALHGYSS